MPTPLTRVRADFDQDGDFTDANSDITTYVRTQGRGMKIIEEINLRKRRSPATILELYLKNDDHRFSPPKATSVLYPLQLPGPNIWVQVGYPVDTFDVADNTTLASRKPDYDSEFDAWAGDVTQFKAQSNRMIPVTAGNYSAVLDFGETDCFVGVKYVRGGTRSGLIVRYSDASNYLLVYNDGTNIRLGEVVSGTLTSIAEAAFTWTASDEKIIGVETHGDVIRVSVDDTLQFSHTTTRFNTATKYGIGGRGTHASDKWDDFGGWRSLFFGRIDRIEPKPEAHNQFCLIRAMDDRERMGQHLVYRTAPEVDNTTAKAILDRILDAVDASSANRILDTGTTLAIEKEHVKSMGRDGLTEAYQLQDDDVGIFTVDGAGYYRYEDSDHRKSAPHTKALKTWRGDPAGGGEAAATDMIVSQDLFRWDDGKENVENEVYYQYHRISRTAAVLVWRLEVDDRPSLNNGITRKFTAVGDEDHIANEIWPVHTTDFTVNTLETGAGTDLLVAEDTQQGTGVSATGSSLYQLDDISQDFTDWNDGKHQVRITDASGTTALAWIGTSDVDGDGTRVALFTAPDLVTVGYAQADAGFDETDTPLTYNVYNVTVEVVTGFDGNFRRIDLYNGSGTNGFITFLRLRADKGQQSSKTFGRAENSKSQTDVGRRRIEHKALHIDKFATAQGRAEKRVELRQMRKEVVTCTMPNKTRAALMQAIHRSMSDRVNLVYTDMGIDDEYHIEGRTLEFKQGNKYVQCQWTLQQTIGGVWGNARWGFFQWG